MHDFERFGVICLESTSLLELKKGDQSTLIQFTGDHQLIERLIDMGLHTGAQIEVIGFLPFSGPIIIRWDNTLLALRKEEALCLQLQINKK